MTKTKWILLLLVGAVLMLLSLPIGNRSEKGDQNSLVAQSGDEKTDWQSVKDDSKAVESDSDETYEKQLEERIKNFLRNVEGVGEVDVMVVLKSSEEKVFRVDTNTSVGQTEEADAQGGSRKSQSSQTEENTILTAGSSGQGNEPLVEKELKPEISGIIISAHGGGSRQIQAEISAAMEALFGLPAHKIKVLKRVD
ncbi:MAG: stage III sporulation protein AG [Lachnospiraceae bacterium]|uniref:Stage III sporulation protein AG n=1 Tax=Candidatus Enterocloster excrementigallinarum TaxID=2838558 RepID=A0A9D2TCB7_9FIRM|nr:stage III sporulation protein AG [Lachnospiraceae bacterium]HJC65245.1 stage III sporulation protein AG [Candidatus Enterocloster excrementigallinarum]